MVTTSHVLCHASSSVVLCRFIAPSGMTTIWPSICLRQGVQLYLQVQYTEGSELIWAMDASAECQEALIVALFSYPIRQELDEGVSAKKCNWRVHLSETPPAPQSAQHRNLSNRAGNGQCAN